MTVTASLDVQVVARGSLKVTVKFYDSTGTAATPKSLNYTLVNKKGEIINNRDKTVITPDTEVSVWLVNKDCPYGLNYFVLSGTYDETDQSDVTLEGWASYDVRWRPGPYPPDDLSFDNLKSEASVDEVSVV